MPNIFERVIKSTHPEYARNAASWMLWDLAYHGGPSYAAARLESHMYEPPECYRDRLGSAAVYNYLRTCCDAWASGIFRPPDWEVAGFGLDDGSGRQSPDRLLAPLALLEKDADRKGTHFLDFFHAQFRRAAPVGHIIIGVDMPRAQKFVSLGHAREAGQRPYLFGIPAVDFLDWQVNDQGEFTMALSRELAYARRFDAGQGEIVDDNKPGAGGGGSYIYHLWTPELFYVIDGRGELLGEPVPNPIAPTIPLTSLQFTTIGHDVIGVGLGADVEPLQARIMNVASELGEILKRQTFSQLVLEGVPLDQLRKAYGTPADQKTQGGDFLMQVGKMAVLAVPPNAKVQYVSPDANQARLLLDAIAADIDEIYRISNLRASGGSLKGGPAESGLSRAIKGLETAAGMAARGQNVADAMTKALVFAAQFQKIPRKEAIAAAMVSPPREYGIVDLPDYALILGQLQNANASVALCEELENLIAKALSPGNPNLLAKMAAERGRQPAPNGGRASGPLGLAAEGTEAALP
jgi:hypothetical protein